MNRSTAELEKLQYNMISSDLNMMMFLCFSLFRKYKQIVCFLMEVYLKPATFSSQSSTIFVQQAFWAFFPPPNLQEKTWMPPPLPPAAAGQCGSWPKANWPCCDSRGCSKMSLEPRGNVGKKQRVSSWSFQWDFFWSVWKTYSFSFGYTRCKSLMMFEAFFYGWTTCWLWLTYDMEMTCCLLDLSTSAINM